MILVLPSLLQHGMFMDGTQYACVAQNLATGKGSFWFPHLSDSWLRNGSNRFLEHLPFTYFLQSLFFRVFGESIFTERIYCLCCLFAGAFLIDKIWKTLPINNPIFRRHSWLPILLWITCGSVFWAYSNNMLEITVSVFVLASVNFMLQTIYTQAWKYIYVTLAGTFVFLACLSKGLPGLFPLVGFIIFSLVSKLLSFKRALAYTLIMTLVPLTIFSFLYNFSSDAHESLLFYFKHRLLNRISNEPLVENRFTILFWVITDMLIPLLVLTLMVFYFRIKKINTGLVVEKRGLILSFLLLGFAGVAPLTLTLVQRAVYFVPALPFFALGISLYLAPGLEEIKERMGPLKNYKKLRLAVVALLFSILIGCSFLFGKISRDEELITDVWKICDHLPAGENVVVPNGVYEEWYTQFYLLRYGKIVLWPDSNTNARFYLARKQPTATAPPGFKPIKIQLTNFELYEKSE